MIVTRDQWGARRPKRRHTIALPSRELWIHHFASEHHGAAGMREIQRFHMDTKGWSDFAYSFAVDDDGTIYEGRGAGVAGGHTQGRNTISHAICAMGNFENRHPPDAMLRSIAVLTDYGKRRGWWHGITGGHRDVGQTRCPGKYLYAAIPKLRKEVTVMPHDPVYKVGSPVAAATWHPTGKFLTIVTERGEVVNLIADEDAERSGDDAFLGRVEAPAR